MSVPHDPDDEASPKVLDELTSAFAGDDPVQPSAPAASDPPELSDAGVDHATEYDFDDPAIDLLLGIEERPAVVQPGEKRTIIIDETDLPDPVYLDEAAEQRLRDIHGEPADAGDGLSTIVIGDVDGGAMVEAPSTTSRPRIDPRVRARRIAVGRAKGRKRLLIGGIVAAAFAVTVATLAVLGSKWFDVRDVSIQGASNSKADVQRVVDGFVGQPVLLLDTLKVEHELSALPWVEAARVETDFPHGMVVDIRERRPVGWFHGADGLVRVIDRDGRVLAKLDGLPTDYPEITGAGPDVEPGSFAGDIYAGAALLIQSLPSELHSRLSAVGADPATGTLTMQLGPNLRVAIGTPTDLTVKLARVLNVLRDPASSKVAAIDVSSGVVTTR